jgi:sialidase-1
MTSLFCRWFAVTGLLATAGLTVAEDAPQAWPSVWESHRAGYHTYRIPALILANDGSLLAFAEARTFGTSDSGDIDVVMKRSIDDGKTWGEQTIVWNQLTNTCGNPCPIVDRETGAIVLVMTWNDGRDKERQIVDRTSNDTRKVFVARSEDNGATWSSPLEFTATVKAEDWTWYATGPGAGIQIERGPHKGRMIVPCDHIEAETKRYYSHVIYSDDQGQTWKRGGRTPRDKVNECQVVELADGRLMLNMRNYDRTQSRRQIAFSSDGGETWTDQAFEKGLPEPTCQASLRRAKWPTRSEPGLIVFSNPASEKTRTNLTVRGSIDEGASWTLAKTLHKGPAAYSDLVVLDDGTIGCLFEAGEKGPYEKIVFARFPPGELQPIDTKKR